jgi:hypothetical protein
MRTQGAAWCAAGMLALMPTMMPQTLAPGHATVTTRLQRAEGDRRGVKTRAVAAAWASIATWLVAEPCGTETDSIDLGAVIGRRAQEWATLLATAIERVVRAIEPVLTGATDALSASLQLITGPPHSPCSDATLTAFLGTHTWSDHPCSS